MRTHRLGPMLVPVSLAVYAAFVALLLRSHYSSACALLGLAIYLASAFTVLHSKVSHGPAVPATPEPAPAWVPIPGLARSRAGLFALTNVVACGSIIYMSFIQHALSERFGAGTAPLLPPAEPLFRSQVGLVILVHLGYSLLYSCFRTLHAHVFNGRLRAAEIQSVSERAATYVGSKVALLAVLGPGTLDAVMWISWFSLLGFLRVVAHLARLRLSDKLLRPGQPRGTRRLVALAHMMLGCGLFWMGAAVLFACTAGAGIQALLLLLAEPALLAVDALACVAHHRTACVDWHAGRSQRHHVDLVHDLVTGLLAVGQHAHTWLLHGLWGTMLDVYLMMSVYSEASILARRFREHRSFLERTAALDKCPVASAEEISHFDDQCAVCLEALLPGPPQAGAESPACAPCEGPARRLVCGHIFHSVCLSAWLEQHRSCPTCRAPTANDAASPQQPDIRMRRPPSDVVQTAAGDDGRTLQDDIHAMLSAELAHEARN